jgi:integrase
LERWLEVVKGRVRDSTYESYELNARRVSAELGEAPLQSLSPALIQASYQHLLRRGLKPYSVLQVHRLLHRSLTHAFHLGLVKKNPPSSSILRGRAGARPRRSALSSSCCCWSGPRALGLAWDDVDLEAGRVSVRRALQRRRGVGLVFVKPKTTRSRRAVELTGRAVGTLREHRERQTALRLLTPGWKESGLVFTGLTGEPMQPHQANTELTRALAAVGLPHIRVHDLRHTTATVMLEASIHPKVVQELLGHKTIATTLDTYSHVLPVLHGQAIRVLGTWLCAGACDESHQLTPESVAEVSVQRALR